MNNERNHAIIEVRATGYLNDNRKELINDCKELFGGRSKHIKDQGEIEMSNRFKLRAWLPSWQEMNYSHAPGDVDWFFNGEHFILSVFYNEIQELEGVVIMQSTGLKDKNGVEIYEGDIVTFSSGGDYIGVIDFDSAMFIVNWKQPCYVRKDLGKLIGINDYMEVIGNIHENPELLIDENDEE